MRPIARLPILLVSGAALLACAGGPQPTRTAITEADIEALTAQWQQAERDDDGMRAAAGYTADATLVTVRGRVDGQAAIERFWGEAFAAQPGGDGTTLHVIEWDADGDLGYALGRFDGGVTAPAGHWLAVVRRQEDGSLKTVAQISIPDPGPAQQDVSAELPGSYELVRRELSDGTVLEPPAIAGSMTYTRTHRHFHLYWPGADGTPSSVSMAATYAIAGEEYSQTTLYEVRNNIPEGSGLDYNIPGATFATPIARRGQVVEFRDGEAGPMLSFTGDSMVATLEGEFVDRWVRVE